LPIEAAGARQFERALYLKKLPLFGSLPSSQLLVLAEYARPRAFGRGRHLLREGEPIGAIYFVTEGKVHLRRQGRELGHALPGSAVGGLGLFARDETGIEARAEAETRTLELDAETLREVFEDHFAILRHVLRESCRQLIDLMIETQSSMPPVMAPRHARLPRSELDLVERIFFMRQAPAFAGSSIDALAELSRGTTEVRLAPGSVLWREGEPSDHVLLLMSGEVECKVERHGFSYRSGPGTPLGSLDALAERPRWYTAAAAGEVVALRGEIGGLIDVFEDHFEMAVDFLAAISQLTLRILERRPSLLSLQEFYGCDEGPAAVAADSSERDR
jgi:CRP-like cAMP-binding protein